MKTVKILMISVFLTSCSSSERAADVVVPAPTRVALPEMAVPADNLYTPGKAALGKQLFFDKRLSRTGNMSCETCHLPEMGWTDGKVLSPKFDGSMNTRHTPTLFNVGYYNEWYWDGRAKTLEAQVLAAWRGQMGADPEQIAATLNGIEGYRAAFQEHMGGPATPDLIVKALATFVRTLTTDDAPWDRYERRDTSAVSDEVAAGFKIFSDSEKANCTLCHLPPLYTDTLFHNTGVGYDNPQPDLGRGDGQFKTPTLRSITETGPYFHDGRAQTLEEAVDFMLAGGIDNPNRDEKLKPKKITPEERTQLLAFMRSLTPAKAPFERPTLP